MAIIEIQRNANLPDLIAQMHKYFPNHVSQGIVLSRYFAAENPTEIGRKIFNYIKKNFTYVPDGKRQKIQSPYRLMKTQKGDCKSFSIFAASILYALDVPCRFVFSSNTDPTKPEHVFVQFLDFDQVKTLDATICCFDKMPDSIKIWFDEWMQ